MRVALVFLSGVLVACERNDLQTVTDSLTPRADSPAPAAASVAERSAGDSATRQALGKEPGTIPATPTPTVTSDGSISSMRSSLQRLDAATAAQLQTGMAGHQKALGDLLTTMRVEVQASASSARDAWLAAADTVEGDLNKLAVAQGEELRTAFRDHRARCLRLLDEFRVLVPSRPD